MIVCVCKRVSDRQILNVIQEGVSTPEGVARQCGAGSDCGSCKKAVAGLIEQHVSSACGLRTPNDSDKRAA